MAHTIKTFRGLLQDGQQERIALQHIDGKTGYRIAKFQVIPNKPVTAANECVLQIFSIEQVAPFSDEIDFSNQTLLGIGLYSNQTDTTYYPDDMNMVFDTVTFNQDIFITHVNSTGSQACNYYLELETFDLNDVEATATILKNFRNTNSVT